MNFKILHTTTLVLILAVYICTTAMCRPSEIKILQNDTGLDTNEYYGNLSPETIRKIEKCDSNMELMELCMRCAKVTQSNIVYPMCCDNEDNVQGWCRRYIYYGKRI